MRSARSRARRPRRRWVPTASVLSMVEDMARESYMSFSESSSKLSIDVKPSSQMIVVQAAREEKKVDYSKVDPPFLDDFDSSAEIVIREEVVEEEAVQELIGVSETSSDADKYAVYEKVEPLTSSTDVYDQLCGPKTVESADSYKAEGFNITRRRKGKEREVALICESDRRPDRRDYLQGKIAKSLIEGLIDVSLYQPNDPVDYLSKYLLNSEKSSSELGLDPDPRKIQELFDQQKKPRRSKTISKDRLALGEEDVLSLVDIITKDLDVDDSSELEELKRKFFSEKGALQDKTQKDKRKLKGRIKADPDCLGPTSLFRGFLPRVQS